MIDKLNKLKNKTGADAVSVVNTQTHLIIKIYLGDNKFEKMFSHLMLTSIPSDICEDMIIDKIIDEYNKQKPIYSVINDITEIN